VLEPSEEEGFVAFGFRAFPEHLEKRQSWTQPHDYKPAAVHQIDPGLDEVYAECAAVAAGEFLRGQGLELKDVAVVLPPWRSPAFVEALGRRLGVPAEKLVTMEGEGDLFTSS